MTTRSSAEGGSLRVNVQVAREGDPYPQDPANFTLPLARASDRKFMVGLPEASSYVRAILKLLPPSRHAEFLRGLEQADEHGITMVNGRMRTLEQYLDEWYWTAVTFGR